MSTELVTFVLKARIQAFLDAVKHVVRVMKPILDARRVRLQRMHSAYGRKRGRGRW